MKKFMIKVNGKVYEVEAEEITGGAAAPAAPAAAPAAPAGATTVSAPMPGTINAVKVSAGQTIKKGDVLVILEAMKMENEIMAPADGTVASVNVTKGASVNTGDVLVTLN